MYIDKPLRILLSAFLITCAFTLEAQVVNIERKRIATDTTGWFGSANLSFAGSKTTKSILSLFAGGLLEYKPKSNKDLWLLISEFSLISGDNEKFSNSGLTKIDTRALGGTGVRIKLTQFEQAKFYLGIAWMYEYEKLLEPEDYNYDNRLSSYFTFTLLPEESVSFTSTTYVQPKFADFSDYRLTNETNLTLGVTKKLNLSVINVSTHQQINIAP